MFDPQFRPPADQLGNGAAPDDALTNGLWSQVSFDQLLDHHDMSPAKSLSMNDANNNDFWSSSAQFNEFFNNYNRQYQQQQQQQNQPLDISSLLSSSPPQPHHAPPPPPPAQSAFPMLPFVDNHIFEPQPEPQPLFFGAYAPDASQLSLRRDSLRPHHQPPGAYMNRSRQYPHFQRQHQYQHHRTPPLLQIPNEDQYQQQQQQQHTMGPSRFKPNPIPAYVACLNHGINYNGVSGPPILLPPSF